MSAFDPQESDRIPPFRPLHRRNLLTEKCSLGPSCERGAWVLLSTINPRKYSSGSSGMSPSAGAPGYGGGVSPRG